MENFISPLRFKKSNYVIRLFSNKVRPDSIDTSKILQSQISQSGNQSIKQPDRQAIEQWVNFYNYQRQVHLPMILPIEIG